MKQSTVFVALTLLLAASSASAETLVNGSVVCIQKKYIEKYQGHLEKGEQAFATDMRDRAQCVINQRPYMVSVLEDSGDYARVEVLNGAKIWVAKTDLVEDSAAPAVEG